jgi:ACS family hexuronate transporter-like MFS transporter
MSTATKTPPTAPVRAAGDPSGGSAGRWRWVAIGVFAVSSVLNYLDRQLLAAVAPTLQSEFGLSNAEYGLLLSAFSVTYMLMAPVAGLLVDRVGLNAGIMIAAGAWSLAGAATGLVQTFRGLFACRLGLGLTQAAGIPCASKASATYLAPSEFSLGNATNSFGITIGSVAAPLAAAAFVPMYGWRAIFVAAGLLGLLWVPLWAMTARRVPPRAETATHAPAPVGNVLRDRRLWGVVAANILIMTLYSLWTNWTTIFFVEEHQLTAVEANQYYAWIPRVFATLGAFFGGWLALRWIGGGRDPVEARIRVARIAAPILLLTAVIPFMESAFLAAAAISFSFFWCMALLINLHVIPIDLFGAGRAAFTAATLTFSFALMQTVVSPVIGALIDAFGFGVVCIGMSVLPLAGVAVLKASIPRERPA